MTNPNANGSPEPAPGGAQDPRRRDLYRALGPLLLLLVLTAGPAGSGHPEIAAIAASGGVVERVGTTLRIATEGGLVALDDDPDDSSDSYTIHTYEGRLEATPFHAIHVSWYESAGYLLVHAETGRQIPLEARPLVSPAGDRLAVAAFDLEARMGPNLVAIHALDGDSLREEWRVEPLDWGPEARAWLDDATFAFTRLVVTGRGAGDYDRVPSLVRRMGSEWVQEDVGEVRPLDSR